MMNPEQREQIASRIAGRTGKAVGNKVMDLYSRWMQVVQQLGGSPMPRAETTALLLCVAEVLFSEAQPDDLVQPPSFVVAVAGPSAFKPGDPALYQDVPVTILRVGDRGRYVVRDSSGVERTVWPSKLSPAEAVGV